MPFRTEGLGVDAGLMSFIQDTRRDTFRTDCWHVATKVPVKSGDLYEVSVDLTEDEHDISKLKIRRVRNGGNFVIEDGCKHVVISDPCYILPDKTWGEFCSSLHSKEQHGQRAYPIFIDHHKTKVAVSSSNGDGYYSCNIETDDDGNLKEAHITFLTEDDGDPEEVWNQGEDDIED